MGFIFTSSELCVCEQKGIVREWLFCLSNAVMCIHMHTENKRHLGKNKCCSCAGATFKCSFYQMNFLSAGVKWNLSVADLHNLCTVVHTCQRKCINHHQELNESCSIRLHVSLAFLCISHFQRQAVLIYCDAHCHLPPPIFLL